MFQHPDRTMQQLQLEIECGCMGDKVGFFNGRGYLGDFYELSMKSLLSLAWTLIEVGKIKPEHFHDITLTAPTETQLILHGNTLKNDDEFQATWIFDILSQTWRQHSPVQN